MANSFSTEENARESERLYAILDGGVRERLMQYPGVRHVSVGLKITGNEMLWERCFHVYVEKKVGADELKKENLIPSEMEGIKTDVHEIGEASLAMAVCEDRNLYRPVKGGISISNGIEFLIGGNLASQFGTLGVIGKIKGACRCNTMALTNWHVLYVGRNLITQSISKGSRVFQPYAGTSVDIFPDPRPDPGTTDYDIGKVVDGIFNTTVDCGLLEVNRSCCNCCGVPFENVINRLETISPLNFNGIRGSARAHTGDPVFFVGAKSGPNKGTVVSDSSPRNIVVPNALIADPRVSTSITENTTRLFTGQIKIITADNSHSCNAVVTMPSSYTGPPFSRVVDHGDSGSLLVNAENMAVGLIFATDDEPPTTAPFTLFGYANHYEDVINALQIAGYNFEINYTQPTTGGSHGTSLVSYEEADSEIFQEWKKRIEEHPKTKAIADAVLYHRDEVILLVNHCRPVTVAWHRAKGPAFAAIVANNIREEKFEFPQVVNGVTAEQLLMRMRDVLLKHGSKSLKDDLDKFGDEILTAVKGENNFEDLLLTLTGESAVQNSLEIQEV